MQRPRRNTILLVITAALLAASVALLVVDDRGERTTFADGRSPAAQAGEKAASAPAPRGTPDAPAEPAAPIGSRSTGDAPIIDDTPASTAAAPLTDADIRAAIERGEPGFEVFASRPSDAESALPIAPRWQAGDQWLVETWYRQAQAPEAPWSGPAMWRFEVAREVSFQDVACHELVVTRVDETGVAPMTLWVSRAGRLVGAETTITQQGKEQRSLYVADDGASTTPAPLRAPPGSAPVRLPPQGALARSAPAGLPFDRTTSKRHLPADLPASSELVGAGRPSFDLEFTDPLDGTTVKQRWSPDDLRWPVVSRTETTLSIRRG